MAVFILMQSRSVSDRWETAICCLPYSPEFKCFRSLCRRFERGEFTGGSKLTKRLISEIDAGGAKNKGLLKYLLGRETEGVGAVALSTIGVRNGSLYGESKVAILLCTYQGQDYLTEQLDSFSSQTHTNWEVWASDDCSTDKTPDILKSYQAVWGRQRFSVVTGPQKGFVANFLSLLCNPDIDADYYAFSDQDDIWDADKLSAAVSSLGEVPSEIPALYCGRTLLVDESNRDIGFSPLFDKPPCFENALLQNIGGGNTMVLNRSARNLLAAAGLQLSVVSHDWWAYMAVTGCGGRAIYDPVPRIRYRQHVNNLVGTNRGLSALLMRLKKILQGRYREWLDVNMAALSAIKSQLTAENRAVFESFSRAREKPYLVKTFAILSSGVHRQTLSGNVGVVVASLFNRI